MNRTGLAYLIAAVFVLTCTVAATGQGMDRIFRVDPVELVNGNNIAGSEGIIAERHKYTYWFASEENREVFESDPLKYEIQMGGGCGRMGPLSGEGRTDIFTVHNDRIYIFASEACRSTFLKGPNGFIERVDPEPQGPGSAHAKGREFIEKAVLALGGAERVDALESYARTLIETTESGGEQIEIRRTLTLFKPNKVRTDLHYGPEYHSANVLNGPDGWFQSEDGAEAMDHQQRQVMINKALHHPIALLSGRHNPEFVAVARGTDKAAVIGGTATVELVDVYVAGALTTLGIDAETGRILLARYRDRGPNLSFGEMEIRYGRFVELDGLILPHQEEAWFDGVSIASQSGELHSIEIDSGWHSDLFAVPAELKQAEETEKPR